MTDATELERLLRERFSLVRSTICVGGRDLTLASPASLDALVDEAAASGDDRVPYWGHIWPAARRLAELLLPEAGAGRTLLELGCGLGLGGVAALAADYQVTVSDYYSEAVDFARLNAWFNGFDPPRGAAFDWHDWPAALGRFDRIVAADVLYEPANGAAIARGLAQALTPGGSALLTDPQRLLAGAFVETLANHGLRVVERSTQIVDDGLNRMTIDAFEIRRKGE